MKIKNIFITGPINIGKSSIIKKFVEQMRNKRIGGFKTIPVIENDIRKGFALESFEGQKKTFAHTDLESNLKFDVYRYDVLVFENFGTQLLDNALKTSDFIIMDEIGMMEKNTARFKESIIKCLDANQTVLGAFQKRAVWFSDILNERSDTKIYFVNEENRNDIHEQIIASI